MIDSISITVILVLLVAPSIEETNCLVLNGAPRKATPSLEQCYRNNANTCCNAYVDSKIKDEYNALMSGSCAREFPVCIVFLS